MVSILMMKATSLEKKENDGLHLMNHAATINMLLLKYSSNGGQV